MSEQTAHLTIAGRSFGESQRVALAAELSQFVRGQIRFSRHDRMLYATDASIYQMEPLGVVIPADVDELAALTAFSGRTGVPLLMRGGGTSLPGQCVNHALVVDYSPTCRKVVDVDPVRRTCFVEPGITVDELNRQLEPTGLFFAPDPATAAQASIGGCIGNNAAGSHSIRYGRTSENIQSIEVALTDGSRVVLGPGAGRRNPRAAGLARGVREIVTPLAELIRQRFPKTKRRNAGYALDAVLDQIQSGVTDEDLDLTCPLCGSEGTLATTLRARLALHPIPRYKGLAVLSFATLEEAIEAVAVCLTTDCAAVELLDDVVLEAARGNAECRQYMDLLPPVDGAVPAAALYVEYQEVGGMDQVRQRFAELHRALPGAAMFEHVDRGALMRAWALRKAGEPLLHGLAGRRKPVTCVEDNAVPVENLVRFVAGFREIVAKHGTKAAYWAHASVGVLHVRPMLDLHDPADLDRMRLIACEVAEWARQCGGVMSGEHGDGRLRGPLLRNYFGDQIMEAFGQVKRVFDSAGVLNPGNITVPGPLESMTQSLRLDPHGTGVHMPDVDTFFTYDDQEDFQHALETCSGPGVCRKTAVGTMCPSYRATLDERHSTRGRANALRLALTGQLSDDKAPAWNDPETLKTLSLCLSCKACQSECPSNVDMARLKAEYLAQSYSVAGHTPLSARVFGHVRKLNRMGSAFGELANAVTELPPTRLLMEKALGVTRKRSLPRYETSLYRWFAKRPPADLPADAPRVVLFADCFVTYNEPRIGRLAIQLLERLGYRILLPRVGCCGRAMISTGLLADATASADKVLAQLMPFLDDDRVKAILVCEPSCLSAFCDDYLKLKCRTPMDTRKKLAARAMQVEDFVDRFWDSHPTRPAISTDHQPPVLLHAHCHQKATSSAETSARLLRRLVGDRLQVLDTGCCGMAGAFGFGVDRYEVSLKIGELSLFPLVRKASTDAVIVAPGTSCRHQIVDGTSRQAVHPIELAHRLLVRR